MNAKSGLSSDKCHNLLVDSELVLYANSLQRGYPPKPKKPILYLCVITPIKTAWWKLARQTLHSRKAHRVSFPVICNVSVNRITTSVYGLLNNLGGLRSVCTVRPFWSLFLMGCFTLGAITQELLNRFLWHFETLLPSVVAQCLQTCFKFCWKMLTQPLFFGNFCEKCQISQML